MVKLLSTSPVAGSKAKPVGFLST